MVFLIGAVGIPDPEYVRVLRIIASRRFRPALEKGELYPIEDLRVTALR